MMKSVRFVLMCTGLVVAVVALSICHTSSSPSTDPGTDPPSPASSAARPPRSWRVLATWKGSGLKVTEPFAIHAPRWRIKWKATIAGPGGFGNLVVVVQRPGSSYPLATAANVTTSGEDTSYVYETGEFVLNVISDNSRWRIWVEVPEG